MDSRIASSLALRFAVQQTGGHSPNGIWFTRGYLAALRSVEIGLSSSHVDADDLEPDVERIWREAAGRSEG